MKIYKTKAVKVAGGTKAELARTLGITAQAVGQWPKGKPIPNKQATKLIALFGEEAFQ